jgi:hypothetical protein
LTAEWDTSDQSLTGKGGNIAAHIKEFNLLMKKFTGMSVVLVAVILAFAFTTCDISGTDTATETPSELRYKWYDMTANFTDPAAFQFTVDRLIFKPDTAPETNLVRITDKMIEFSTGETIGGAAVWIKLCQSYSITGNVITFSGGAQGQDGKSYKRQ